MADNQFGWLRTFWSAAPRINRTAAILIALALLFALNPEVRIALLAIDAIGFDVFLFFLLFQVQAGASYLYRNCMLRIGRLLLDWGPVPFSMPTRRSFERHPALAISSLASPVAAAGVLLSVLFLTAMWVDETLRYWS